MTLVVTRMRNRLILILAVVVWALVAPTSGSASSVGHFCLALNTPAAVLKPRQVAQRNSYVVLQSWETARAAQLKAANPDLEVLVYQNLSAMTEGTSHDGHSSSGVNFAEAVNVHPDWFLREAKGKRIAELNYSYLWMADVGNPAYQQQWTANVLNTLQSGPWDGVFMDDTNASAKFHVDPPSKIVKYPTDAAYQEAMRSMLAYAGPQIMAAGKLAIPNMGSWHEYPEVIEGWLQFVSGGMDQQFVKTSPFRGQGYAPATTWLTQLREIKTTERMGKRFLAATSAPAGDNRARRYGWASVLLAGGGHTAFFASNIRSGDTWSPEYEVPLGRPASGATPIGAGGWARAFAAGLVVVNPTAARLKLRFDGVYSGSGLKHAQGATLRPHTALILIRDIMRKGALSIGTSLRRRSLAGAAMPVVGVPPRGRYRSR